MVGEKWATTKETTPGIYAQYTYNLNEKVVAMAGIRADHSSRYGTFVTPRFHLKLSPNEVVSLRLSVGKGYRSVHALAENNNLLASGRQLVIDDLKQEEAWNSGLSSSFYIPLFGKTLKLNAEYYHTHFNEQAVIDYDSNSTEIRISNLDGKSYSNTIQVDASYPVIQGLELTAAWRWNDVKSTYGGELMEKPLTSRYKGLVTVSYKTPLGIWQFDATLQLNGGGRMPRPFLMHQVSLSGTATSKATSRCRHKSPAGFAISPSILVARTSQVSVRSNLSLMLTTRGAALSTPPWYGGLCMVPCSMLAYA